MCFRFALLPSRRILAEDKEVWRVPDTQVPAIAGPIGQPDSWGLVVILQDMGIMFELIDSGEFVAMAFKLNSDAHFSTGIPPADVAGSTSHCTGWPSRADLLQQYSGLR